MFVTSVVQKPDGKNIKFEADLTEEEFAFIFNQGLNLLLAQGAIKPEYLKEEDKSGIVLS
jgi:hypothetical protein